MNIIEKIDYNPIFSYMKYCLYGYLGGDNTPCEDKEHFLRFYNENKKTLYKLLGNELSISKTIEIEKTLTELDKEFYDLLEGYGKYNKYQGYHFRKIFRKAVENSSLDRNTKSKLVRLLIDSELSNNYLPSNIEFELNEKRYKFPMGSKPMTVIKKVVEILDIDKDYFEKFRLGHSMVLNEKSFNGVLCLSIHPLDYMTMSDNRENWSSCMSWLNDGCYKRGTIEMMNSPYVVVAYLASKTNKLQWENNGEAYEWNSKKWRQLFIVHPDFITSIKGYPYHNEALTEKAIAWIKELATANLNYSYNDKLYRTNDFYGDSRDGTLPIKSFDIYTDAMYNDFGTTTHLIYFSDNAKDISLNYSGESQCIVCGDCDSDFEHEGSLVCDECCGNVYYCKHCGERGHDDEGRWINDDWVCDECYGEYYNCCEACDTDFLIEESKVKPIYLFTIEYSARTYAERYICEDCRKYYQPRYNSETDEYYFLPDDTNVSRLFGSYSISRAKASEEYLSKN